MFQGNPYQSVMFEALKTLDTMAVEAERDAAQNPSTEASEKRNVFERALAHLRQHKPQPTVTWEQSPLSCDPQ
jgi:hypothetical protein